MTEAARALWARLHEAGVVAVAEAPAAAHTPWFIHALLGICAWFAAGFLMGFFGLLISDLFRNEAGLIVIGLMLCAGALALLRAVGGNVFLGQFALPFSLTGQGMIAIGAAQFGSGFNEFAVGMAMQVVGVLMATLSAQPAHRFLSSAMALCGLALTLFEHGGLGLLPPVFAAGAAAFWLGARESLPRAHYAAWRPAMHAVNLALLGSVWFTGRPLGFEPAISSLLLAQIIAWGGPLLAVIWLVSVFGLLRARGLAPLSAPALPLLAAALLLALLLFPAPGVLATLMLMLLGFAAAERSVLAVGMIGLLVYLARYYYQLDISLLAKSGVLVASGLALLGLRLVPRVLERRA